MPFVVRSNQNHLSSCYSRDNCGREKLTLLSNTLTQLQRCDLLCRSAWELGLEVILTAKGKQRMLTIWVQSCQTELGTQTLCHAHLHQVSCQRFLKMSGVLPTLVKLPREAYSCIMSCGITPNI